VGSRSGNPDDERLRALAIYEVGGAVRDALLGREPADHDWVVVGASPDVMIQRGFRPVGRDFPVFVHPDTGEEYALARTERKVGPGYRGFTFHTGPDVTLEDDLRRRDLTINAMARTPEGELVDPWCGRADLADGRLRHVSAAFGEDPVRVLRLARFAARFPTFSVAAETLALCRRMAVEGETRQLVAERVWQELSAALMSERPSRFFEVLREIGALADILPEIDCLFGVPQVAEHHPEIDAGVHTLMVVDQAAALAAPLAARYAALLHDLGKALTPPALLPRHSGHEKAGLAAIDAVSERLRVPTDCRDLARLVGHYHLIAHRALELRPARVVQLLEALDAFRRPQRLEPFLLACEADRRGRKGREHLSYPQAEFLRRAHERAQCVNVRELIDQGLAGPAIADALHAARVRAVADLERPAF